MLFSLRRKSETSGFRGRVRRRIEPVPSIRGEMFDYGCAVRSTRMALAKSEDSKPCDGSCINAGRKTKTEIMGREESER